MERLVRLEFLKLRHHKATWILLGLYLLAVAALAFGGGLLLHYLAEQGVSYRGLDPTILPIYDFADVWQNLAYVAYFFKVFPAFLLIISVSNEFSYKTHRQNIIDGLSRKEFFVSKLSFAAFLALASALFLFLAGLVSGLIYSPVRSLSDITGHLFFLPAHALQLFVYFLFAILTVLLLRRSGISIMALLMYTVILEPIAGALLKYRTEISPSVMPLKAISEVIPPPFGKYLLRSTQDYLTWNNLWPALSWGLIFLGLIFWILRKRDF